MELKPGRATITLDRPRTLHYDMQTVALIEKDLGRPFDELLLEEDWSLNFMLVVIWAGLFRDDPTLTKADVGSLLTARNIDMVADKFYEAIGAMEIIGSDTGGKHG